MNNPLISIIVPVYNVEKYLRPCLDSILSQTYTNWEAILVDDGSKDNSGKICDEYANKDNRFRVIHKENGGVSSARNRGIEDANGDWFYFSDSDDLLYEDTLNTFISRIKDDIDSVCGSFIEIDEKDDSIIRRSSSKEYEKEIDRNKALKDFYKPFYSDIFNGCLWNRLFRADIIRLFNLKFREDIYIKEDGLFLVQFICKCQGKHVYTSKLVYKYRVNRNGTMKTYGRTFNKKTCSNLYARCHCYEAIKTVTDDRMLLKLSKNSILHKYKRLLLLFIKDKNKNYRLFFNVSLKVFRCITPLYILERLYQLRR